ncbi:MAG TPA: hypothetical protein VFN71_15540 [Methylomirabilota bacterium]|nr:hypothetical protein [Methylomirabilota bacterium]
MITRSMGVTLIAAALVFLTGCGNPTKEDLLAKARGASTRQELEKALGRPSDIAKVGPVEKWTYKASNGQVVFIIVGDTVTIEATGSSAPKQ